MKESELFFLNVPAGHFDWFTIAYDDDSAVYSYPLMEDDKKGDWEISLQDI